MNKYKYAKLSEVKAGEVLIADNGFTCVEGGRVLIKEDEHGLYFDCDVGKHYLDGQVDDGEYLVGLTK